MLGSWGFSWGGKGGAYERGGDGDDAALVAGLDDGGVEAGYGVGEGVEV